MTQLALFVANRDLHWQTATGTPYVDVRKRRGALPHDGSVISLFSGAGGLDIGLEQSGYKTCLCIELDRDCCATLRHNRPDWPVLEGQDIRQVSVEAALEAAGLRRGDVALVVGGAPCQPFSRLGSEHGAEDERNGDLFKDFVRFVSQAQPAGFIFENVAAIAQSKHADVLRLMESAFADEGYSLTCALLNAADYGVPQRRLRFFMLGRRDGIKPRLPLPTHQESQDAWADFTRQLDHAPLYDPQRWLTVQDAFAALPADYKARPDYRALGVSQTVHERMIHIAPGENFKVLPPELLPSCWASGKHTASDTFGRLRPDAPSVTIRTAAYNPSKGRYIHPAEHRGLDTIEMAALQSFPYSWRFCAKGSRPVSITSAGRQIGNAVPPLLARAIGSAIFQ